MLVKKWQVSVPVLETLIYLIPTAPYEVDTILLLILQKKLRPREVEWQGRASFNHSQPPILLLQWCLTPAWAWKLRWHMYPLPLMSRHWGLQHGPCVSEPDFFWCYLPLSLLPHHPLLPPATTHLRLPPLLGWTLRHIPPALGLWCPAASPTPWGALDPPTGSFSCLSFWLWVVSRGLLQLPLESLGSAWGRAGSSVETENQKRGLGWERIKKTGKYQIKDPEIQYQGCLPLPGCIAQKAMDGLDFCLIAPSAGHKLR